jgi:hypothetical protein
MDRQGLSADFSPENRRGFQWSKTDKNVLGETFLLERGSGAGRMENSGRQEYHGCGVRGGDIRGHLFHLDRRVGVKRAYDMATDAGHKAMACFAGLHLTNRGIRYHHTHEEAHQ